MTDNDHSGEPGSVTPPVSSRSRKKKRAKSDSIGNPGKATGGLASRRKFGGRKMSEHKETHHAGHKQNGSGVLESIKELRKDLLSVEGAKKVAAWYIDTSEKVANQAIDLQESATKWAKETPLAPIFEAQIEYGKKFVERSANAARSLWRIE
jgi:hypothetical protein